MIMVVVRRFEAVSIALVFLMLAASPANADAYVGTATSPFFPNVYDLEMAFIGSGGEINNVATNGNEGPGMATITTTGSEITIKWDDGGFGLLNSINFTFDGPPGLELITAYWSFDDGSFSENSLDNITGIPEVPEPSTFFLAASGLLGFAVARRHGSRAAVARKAGAPPRQPEN